MGNLTFTAETFDEALPDIQTYWDAHWREVGIDHETTPLAVDIERYRTLYDLGMLLILVARDQGTAVGYMVWSVTRHPRYDLLVGTTDVFWLHPDYRGGNGIKMFLIAEALLKERGVQRLVGTCKVDHPLDTLYQGLGWEPFERVFTKRIG